MVNRLQSFALENGERVECVLVLDASPHVDVCNFNDLEVLRECVRDDRVISQPPPNL